MDDYRSVVDLRRTASSNCEYILSGKFSFLLENDLVHPDQLTGIYTYDAHGTELENIKASREDCLSNYGSPEQITGHATYAVTSVKERTEIKGWDADIAVSLVEKSREGYCTNGSSYAFGQNPILYFKKIDDQHLSSDHFDGFYDTPRVFQKQTTTITSN